jgi:putative transposase
MTSDFCVEALSEALVRYGPPEIFNTDQGSQFTSHAFTGTLKAAGVAINMDGRGRWQAFVFIERLWRTLKYEEIYLRAYDTVADASAGIRGYLAFYNRGRTHQKLGSLTPDEVYFQSNRLRKAA